MKNCPRCGREFGWWQRAVGEHREHMRTCCAREPKDNEERRALAARCRGCPAGCFEEIDYGETPGLRVP
jgi:hypothetical protein